MLYRVAGWNIEPIECQGIKEHRILLPRSGDRLSALLFRRRS